MSDELILSILYWIWLTTCIAGSTLILFRGFIIDFIDETKQSNISLKEFFLDIYFPEPIKFDEENFRPMFKEGSHERGYQIGGPLIIDSLEDDYK